MIKKNKVLLSAILLSTSLTILEAKNPQKNNPKKNDVEQSKDIDKKPSKNKAATPLKVGDKLTMSDFTKTNSGVMFKVVQKGSGSKPYFGENVVVHYNGYLLQGTDTVGIKFDSSVDRDMPFQFKLGARQVISGWEISLADMQVGEERIVILPSKQAYGSRATAKIPADSTLIFEIKLIQTT